MDIKESASHFRQPRFKKTYRLDFQGRGIDMFSRSSHKKSRSTEKGWWRFETFRRDPRCAVLNHWASMSSATFWDHTDTSTYSQTVALRWARRRRWWAALFLPYATEGQTLFSIDIECLKDLRFIAVHCYFLSRFLKTINPYVRGMSVIRSFFHGIRRHILAYATYERIRKIYRRICEQWVFCHFPSLFPCKGERHSEKANEINGINCWREFVVLVESRNREIGILVLLRNKLVSFSRNAYLNA